MKFKTIPLILILILILIFLFGCNSSQKTDQELVVSLSSEQEERLFSIGKVIQKKNSITKKWTLTKEQVDFLVKCVQESTGKPDALAVTRIVSSVTSGPIDDSSVPDQSWLTLSESILNSCEKSSDRSSEMFATGQSVGVRLAFKIKNISLLNRFEKYKGKMSKPETEKRLEKLLAKNK